jgi:hypothetical protein
MNSPLVWFWTFMIYGSIAWYTVLLFVIGYRGGLGLIQMTRRLKDDGIRTTSRDD